ncbi:hypothetical protein SASPL_137319 [Salvia splendens]|uniref:Uncharacterized protein n=1 Tax=Salvia splendens TaxID=180675 RepID=A0A8X8ZCU3_SALSN|nr:hypothetical protein SASPL_137319 [Salvia splendens]
MSIINIALIVLFLSLHSSNARVIPVPYNHPAKDFVKGNDVVGEKSVGDRDGVSHVVKDSISKRNFRVHQKKRGEDEEAAGFNLDYLPPRTHPPSHN